MTSETTEPGRTGAVQRYARTDVIGGALTVLAAGLVWYGAIGLNVGTLANFETGAMPKILSVILGIAGAAVFVLGLLRQDEDAERLEFALRPTAIVFLSIVLFALFIRGGDFGMISTPQLGLAIIGPANVFIAGCASHRVRARELLVLAFGLTAAGLLVFPDLLGVTIPVFPKPVLDAIPPSFGADAAIRVVACAYGGLAAILYVIFFRLSETRRG